MHTGRGRRGHDAGAQGSAGGWFRVENAVWDRVKRGEKAMSDRESVCTRSADALTFVDATLGRLARACLRGNREA